MDRFARNAVAAVFLPFIGFVLYAMVVLTPWNAL